MTTQDKGLVLLVGGLAETAALRPALAEGFECCWTDDLNHALELLAAKRFDAIVADYQLPFGDGLELLNKAIAIHPNMSGVLLARFTNNEAALKEKAAGKFVIFGDADEVPHIMLWLERHVAHSQLMLALEHLNEAIHRRVGLPSG